MTDTIDIRPAIDTDARPLAVLATQVWLDNYAQAGIHPSIADYVLSTFTPAKFSAMLADPLRLILVAARGKSLVGLALVVLERRQHTLDAARQAELDRLYVQEPFCRTGIGSRLLAATESALVQHGIDAYWLQAWIGNQRALSFYLRNGLADIGESWFELGSRKHENRVLAKRLR